LVDFAGAKRVARLDCRRRDKRRDLTSANEIDRLDCAAGDHGICRHARVSGNCRRLGLAFGFVLQPE
jgi:hypothetical protein